jgi:hypothetical protein
VKEEQSESWRELGGRNLVKNYLDGTTDLFNAFYPIDTVQSCFSAKHTGTMMKLEYIIITYRKDSIKLIWTTICVYLPLRIVANNWIKKARY